RFNASVAEMNYQDKWQRSLLGFSMIGNDKKYLESSLQQISALLQTCHDFEVTQERVEFF
ncbi:MAG TPA: DUF503 family protein, partial [bacterium]|nr:DUF503 family protein [bacterium]